jgi:serine/threonine protein kinase
MGDVDRARDARLGRDVALKILPTSFASDPERIARFDREARTLATLNPAHRRYLRRKQTNGLRALALEFVVKGKRWRIALHAARFRCRRRSLSPRQITKALEAAHERGIIDRDRKPANIKITQDGVVKVRRRAALRTSAATSGRLGVSFTSCSADNERWRAVRSPTRLLAS